MDKEDEADADGPATSVSLDDKAPLPPCFVVSWERTDGDVARLPSSLAGGLPADSCAALSVPSKEAWAAQATPPSIEALASIFSILLPSVPRSAVAHCVSLKAESSFKP